LFVLRNRSTKTRWIKRRERGAWTGAYVAQSPLPSEPKSTTTTDRKVVTRS
jgi:hypothetical protein